MYIIKIDAPFFNVGKIIMNTVQRGPEGIQTLTEKNRHVCSANALIWRDLGDAMACFILMLLKPDIKIPVLLCLH